MKKLDFIRDDIIDLLVNLTVVVGCGVIGGICFYAGMKYQITENQEQQPVEVVEQKQVLNGINRLPGSKVR